MKRDNSRASGLQDFFQDEGHYRAAAFILLALALALSLLGLRRDIWLDEYLTLRAINLPTLGGMLADLRSDTSPPLYFALLRGWAVPSVHETWLRVFSILVFLASLTVVLRWLKPFSRPGSLVAGLFLATFPLALRYAVEIRAYGLLLLFTSLAFWGAARLAREPENQSGALLMGFGLVGAVATHLVGCFLLLPCGLFLVLARKPEVRLPWGRVLAALAVPAAVFWLFYGVYLDKKELQAWWLPPLSWELLASGVLYVFDSLSHLGPLGQVYAWSPALALVLVFLGIGLITLLVIFFIIAGDWRLTFPFFLAAALYWLQLAAFSVLVKPVFWDRTLLPSLAPIAGFVGLQAVTLSKRWIRLPFLALSVAAALTFSLTWALYWSPRATEECRLLARVLASQWRPGDVVVIYPSWSAGPVLHYFPALPPGDVVGVKTGGEGPPLEANLAARLNRRETRSPTPRLFLLVRLDTLVAQRQEALREILGAVQRHHSRGEPLQVLLSFDAHINLHPGMVKGRANLLADLAERFGPPRRLQKFEAFYWLIYDAPLVGKGPASYY